MPGRTGARRPEADSRLLHRRGPQPHRQSKAHGAGARRLGERAAQPCSAPSRPARTVHHALPGVSCDTKTRGISQWSVKAVRRDPDDAGLRRYLLGLLPETEAELVEESYLAQPEALARVRGVEDDLLDDYAADRLDPAEKAAFESRYHSSQVLRERVAAARALRMAAASETLVPA